MPNTSDETTAEAELSEAAAMARANVVMDQQNHQINQARMNLLLKVIDLLVVAGVAREPKDLFWLLPPCGFDVWMVLPHAEGKQK